MSGKWARAEDGSKIRLREDADNWPTLQPFILAHSAVQLPPGVWPIAKTLNVTTGYTLSGYGVDRTALKIIGDFAGPVVGLGGNGAWQGSTGLGRADGVTLRGLTAWQTSNVSTICQGIHANGNDLVVRNVRVRGTGVEGLVAGGNNLRFYDVEAWDCGNGIPSRTLSTAGLNIFGSNTVVDGFVTLRCGQGIETGHSHIVWRNGVVSVPGDGSPNIGLNIGSTAKGVYDVLVEDVTIDGYTSLAQMGPNGIGRQAKVILRRCKFYGGSTGSAITFAGGQPTNVVTGGDNPYEGPDTEGSEVSGCEFYFEHPTGGGVVYNSQPNSNGVYGREPLWVYNNDFHYDLSDPSQQFGATVGFGGRITANCLVENNRIHGLAAAPPGGDINSVSITGNEAVQGFPTLLARRNVAYTPAGAIRPVVVRIEGL